MHEQYGDRWWFRHLCAVGGVFNVLSMLSANLVGFAVGIEGMKYMIQQLFGSWQGRPGCSITQHPLIIFSVFRNQIFVCDMFCSLFSGARDV